MAQLSANVNKTTTPVNQDRYAFQITIIGVLFFFFGFVTWTNSILVPYLQIACELSDFLSYFVTFAFYAAYFVMAIPAAAIIRKVGYRRGIVYGLLVCAVGTAIFIPAAFARLYLIFLLGLYVLGSGLAILQTAANPYVSILGKPGGASSRLNIMGVCNSVAGIIAPLIFGFITLNNADQLKKELLTLPTAERLARLDELSSRVIIPYLIITLVLVGLATMVHFSGLPEIDTDAEDTSLGDQSRKTSVFQFRHLVLGIVAIFCYVGVEVMAVDTVVNFGTFQGFSFETAASFPAAVVLAMFFGRFAGIFVIGKRIAPSKALVLTASVGFGLALLAMFTQGYVSIGCLVLMGLCNSVMWPIIFPLAITGLGRFTKIGSSYLIMAIVGGAIIPLVYGRLADPDLLNRQAAYVVFLPCYIFLLYYGWRGYKTVASGQ